jgi:hypothetical protein
MPKGMSDIPTQIYGSADFQSVIKQLCWDFADIFCREVKSEPARVEPLKVDIDWDKWRIPKNGGPPRPQSTEKMEKTWSQIERMLELDLIDVHLVRKPTGKWRFCIDFRTINDLCGNIGWPIPNIATLERIGSKKPKVFAKFDMTSGYFQMAFDPSIRDATSIIYPGGVYRWKRTPMGWKSAGAHFQQQLAGVLNGLLYKVCELYMDDILPFAESEEMLQRLHRLFTPTNALSG